MRDTSPAQQEEYFARLRALTPEERLRIASRLTRGGRQLAMIGIKLAHPKASEEEVHARLAVRLYGRGTACRLFAEVPADAV
ncbi:MAG TPA: hypothetical protein VH083_08735 [Myxococcales bacterium]|jgi:hypothetical protein|nr:hypothetical protein [Myxococcales bacterium]